MVCSETIKNGLREMHLYPNYGQEPFQIENDWAIIDIYIYMYIYM